MRLRIHTLNFSLTRNPFGNYPTKMEKNIVDIKKISKAAGMTNDKFKKAHERLLLAIRSKENLVDVIDTPLMIRALGEELLNKQADNIDISNRLLIQISQVQEKPSTLFLQKLYQYYLLHFDELDNCESVGKWLYSGMKKRGLAKNFHHNLLSFDGPKWLAQECTKNQLDFNHFLSLLSLDNYSTGRFISIAQNFYYLEQLRSIPVNDNHPILAELQQPEAFNSRYDEHSLLGHEVLKILITRAPKDKIDDSWLNVIMAIAGDPRVPSSNEKYIKWWSQLDNKLNHKVRGWLSRLDLRLFLEALENYSYQSGDYELQRMFGSRKHFMEGLLAKKLVLNTRLYLSPGAASFLRRNYRREHLPEFSEVTDGGKSLIYLQLDGAHIIEGSHSCYMWIYKTLDSSSIVFDYNKKRVTYSSLTQGHANKMAAKGSPHLANITHNPTNFHWQRKAIETLAKVGVNISPKDVLMENEYLQFKRRFGVRGY